MLPLDESCRVCAARPIEVKKKWYFQNPLPFLDESAFYQHMPIGKLRIYTSFTVCVCVCTVMHFSAVDKASGVKFCTEVHRRPRQGISHFCELCSQKPKISQIFMCMEIILTIHGTIIL